MGIINLVTTGAKTGLGLFKTEAKCFIYAGTLASQPAGDDLKKAVVFEGNPTTIPNTHPTPPSSVPRVYDGNQIIIYGQTIDPQTKVIKASSRCTVARYLIVGQLTTAIPVGAAATITIRGGRGSVGGDDDIGTNGFTTVSAISTGIVNVRFGSINGVASGMPADVALTGIASGGPLLGDTVLTVTGLSPATAVPAGTTVFIGIGTDFHLARLSGCSSTAIQATEAPFDIVPTGYSAPNCPPDTTRQLSTLTAYYGGVADDGGDSGCGSECAVAGCDPANNKFGSGGTCVNKWGSGRALQDPSARWRVVALVANGNEFRAYVDGLHDGCELASGECSLTPPIEITGATAVALNNFRVGLMDAQGSASNDFATMDLAEMMIYDRALTAQVHEHA